MHSQLRIELSQMNEVELVYRTRSTMERPKVISSFSAADILRPYFDLQMETRELFIVLMLDRGNKAKAVYVASSGGTTGTVADPKLIFCAALKCLAASIVIAHNHPSGQLVPSEQDIRLTKKIVDGGALLDIPVFDHLILTRHGCYSFADSGMLVP